MAWVVGLIIPILLALDSVNQRLPSGPAVIPWERLWRSGWELGDGVGRRVDHPDAAASVNQRFPSGPVVIPTGPLAAGERELGDGGRRQQATILQPFEPGPCPDPVGQAAAGTGGEQGDRCLQEEVSPESTSRGSGMIVRRGHEEAPFSGLGERESRRRTDRPGRRWPARCFIWRLKFNGRVSAVPVTPTELAFRADPADGIFT